MTPAVTAVVLAADPRGAVLIAVLVLLLVVCVLLAWGGNSWIRPAPRRGTTELRGRAVAQPRDRSDTPPEPRP